MNIKWDDGGTGYLTAGGRSLEYRCIGPGPSIAPTLVLLHEGLGCVSLWRDFPQRLSLATGWGVFVYSRAGYGQSDPCDLPRPLDYMSREAQEVLPQVLDKVGVQKAVLVGHSDGATIAAVYAGTVPDFRVRGLILMAPHMFTEDMGLAEIRHAKIAFETSDLKDKMAKYHRDPECAFRGWNDAWLAPGFRAWDVSEAIDYIRVPVLAIQGCEDQYGTAAQVRLFESRSYAPVEVMMLEDCRHAPHQDQPDRVLAAMANFTHRLARMETAEVNAG